MDRLWCGGVVQTFGARLVALREDRRMDKDAAGAGDENLLRECTKPFVM